MLKRLIVSIILVFSLTSHAQSNEGPGREFIMATIYGVLAGTLVGVATLAFTNNPGDNLKNVARGASLGLYAGIGLGFYVTNYVPDEDVEAKYDFMPSQPKFALVPRFNEKTYEVDGATVQINLTTF